MTLTLDVRGHLPPTCEDRGTHQSVHGLKVDYVLIDQKAKVIKVVAHIHDVLARLIGQVRDPARLGLVTEMAQYVAPVGLVLPVLAEKVE